METILATFISFGKRWIIEKNRLLRVCLLLKLQKNDFHTRAMRKALFTKFGRVAPNLKPAILRAFYRELTGDSSAAVNEHVEEIDEQVRLLL